MILTAGIGCYDFPGNVLQQSNKNQRQANDAGLKDDASNFLDCLEAINRNLQNVSAQQEMIAALRRLKPALRGLRIAVPARDHAVVSLRAEPSGADIVFDLSQESEGFRRFLAHSDCAQSSAAQGIDDLRGAGKGVVRGRTLGVG